MLIWKRLVACLLKVLVKCQCLFEPTSFHYDERNAVCERVSLVRSLLEPTPSSTEKIVGYTNRFNPRASEQSSTNFDCFTMMSSAVEKRHHLIENVGGRPQYMTKLGWVFKK